MATIRVGWLAFLVCAIHASVMAQTVTVSSTLLSGPIRQGQSITLKGQIVDSQGRPFANVQAGVEDGIAKICTTTPRTNSQGYFEYATQARFTGVNQVTFVAPGGRRRSVWVSVLPGDRHLPTMGVRSLSIRNGSNRRQEVTVTAGNVTRSATLQPGQQVRAIQVNPRANPFPVASAYVATTVAGGVPGGKASVDVSLSNDGTITTTLTAGALLLRGKVYVDNTWNFGGCWAPGVDLFAGPIGVSAEGFVCLGTNGVSIGTGTGASAGPTTVGVEIRVRPL